MDVAGELVAAMSPDRQLGRPLVVVVPQDAQQEYDVRVIYDRMGMADRSGLLVEAVTAGCTPDRSRPPRRQRAPAPARDVAVTGTDLVSVGGRGGATRCSNPTVSGSASVAGVRVPGHSDRVQVPKPTEQDKDHFRALIPAEPDVAVKPMFGNLGAFVNGNMFAGLFGSTLGVRLMDDASLRELEAVEGTGPFGPAERPMGGYIGLPADWAGQPGQSQRWIEIALAQVRALPPKAVKPKVAKRSR